MMKTIDCTLYTGMSVECEFSEAFVCGYSTPDGIAGVQPWVRYSGPSTSGPVVDYRGEASGRHHTIYIYNIPQGYR